MMKVSETEICPLTRGICTIMREPKLKVSRLISAKRKPMSESCTRLMVKTHATKPRAMMAQMNGFARRCFVAALDINSARQPGVGGVSDRTRCLSSEARGGPDKGKPYAVFGVGGWLRFPFERRSDRRGV